MFQWGHNLKEKRRDCHYTVTSPVISGTCRVQACNYCCSRAITKEDKVRECVTIWWHHRSSVEYLKFSHVTTVAVKLWLKTEKERICYYIVTSPVISGVFEVQSCNHCCSGATTFVLTTRSWMCCAASSLVFPSWHWRLLPRRVYVVTSYTSWTCGSRSGQWLPTGMVTWFFCPHSSRTF